MKLVQPSKIANRSKHYFRSHAECQNCDWSKYTHGLKFRLDTLQKQAREHVHDNDHTVVIDTHRITTYTPITHA